MIGLINDAATFRERRISIGSEAGYEGGPVIWQLGRGVHFRAVHGCSLLGFSFCMLNCEFEIQDSVQLKLEGANDAI